MSKAQGTISAAHDWLQEPIDEKTLAYIQQLAGEARLGLDAASEQMFRVPAE